MKRLRFFRILLPIILIPFLVMVGVQLRKRPKSWSPPGTTAVEGSSATGIHATDLEGPNRRFDLKADSYSDIEDGKQRLRGINPLTVFRDGALPLVITADLGDMDGAEPGKRFVRIEGGIRISDEESGLLLSLPVLEIDEEASEARSVGEVLFEAEGYRGVAEAVIYPLDSKPPWFRRIRIHGDDGTSLEAERLILVDGSDDVLLERSVNLAGPGIQFQAESVQVLRTGEEGRLSRVIARESVEGSTLLQEEDAHFLAGALDLKWDKHGEPEFILLDRNATLHWGAQGLAARMVRLIRTDADQDSGPAWDFLAGGGVFFQGISGDAPVTLQAARIEGRLGDEVKLETARATGSVRFTGADSLAEADSADILAEGEDYRITLHSSPALRARVAGQQYRIAARTIELLSGSQYVLGQGRVEATLLPPADTGESRSGDSGGMFRRGEAVHFVSDSMETSTDGTKVTFRTAVRGWQGERTLSADTVTISKDSEDLVADGKVGTRIPGKKTDSLSDSDFVHITGDHLEYSGTRRIATWTGSIHVRQDEGWLEADRLDAVLFGDGQGLKSMSAIGAVRLEYRVRSDAGIPERVQGNGDRTEFDPVAGILRLFGDSKQATLRKTGKNALTLSGRILRYYVDDGAIEVEKGLSGYSTIQTSDPGEDEKRGESGD